MKKVLFCIFAMFACMGIYAQQSIYRIGESGPAGGIIFYDKENYSDGWRYLEAAPDDLGRAEWGLYDIIGAYPIGIDVVGTLTGIGSGKRNTELIILALNRRGETNKAAQLCWSFTFNGYNDWYLPSRDELDLLYKNLKSRNNGRFEDGLYWSSSQYTNNYSYSRVFNREEGMQGSGRNSPCNVRAVRSF